MSEKTGWEYHDGHEVVVGRLVPLSGGSGICPSCGGVLDAGKQGVCVCFSGLRSGEPRVSESELARVWSKYRHRLWGTDFMGYEDFRYAVRELLSGKT